MKIIFIRHGKTAGNCEKRYIGKTDEPLSHEGIKELSERNYPEAEIVIISGMKRCVETAKLIYPNQKHVVINGLRECDFGDFEGKNYKELSDNPGYKSWVESGGILPFPNGESPVGFKIRCVAAFDEAVQKFKDKSAISFVVHGGTIMAVLEKYALPKKDYFDYGVENGGGYITEFDGEIIRITEKI